MLSVFRVACFALLALSLFQVIDARVVRRASAGSNGDRLARGIPLPRPKRLYDPSKRVARDVPSNLPTTTATDTSSSSTPTPPPSSSPTSASTSSSSSSASSSPSQSGPAPGSTPTGYIAVYQQESTSPLKKRSTPLGYVGPYGMALTEQMAWQYSFTEPTPLDAVVELNSQATAPYAGYRLSALAPFGSAGVTMGPGNTAYLTLRNTNVHTPAGATAGVLSYNNLSTGYAQTTVFSVDPDTNEITVKWVNPDGSTPQIYVVEYSDPSWSYGLYLTGDLSMLASQLGTTVSALNVVNLYIGSPATASP